MAFTLWDAETVAGFSSRSESGAFVSSRDYDGFTSSEGENVTRAASDWNTEVFAKLEVYSSQVYSSAQGITESSGNSVTGGTTSKLKTSETTGVFYSSTSGDYATASGSSYSIRTSYVEAGDYADTGTTVNDGSNSESTTETDTRYGASTITGDFEDLAGATYSRTAEMVRPVGESVTYSTTTRTAAGANTQSTTDWGWDCEAENTWTVTSEASTTQGEHSYTATRVVQNWDVDKTDTFTVSYLTFPEGDTAAVKSSYYDRAAGEVLWQVKESIRPEVGLDEVVTGNWREIWETTVDSVSYSFDSAYAVDESSMVRIVTVSLAEVTITGAPGTSMASSYDGVAYDPDAGADLTKRDTFAPEGGWAVTGTDAVVVVTTQAEEYDSDYRNISLVTGTETRFDDVFLFSQEYASWWMEATTRTAGPVFETVSENKLFPLWVSQSVEIPTEGGVDVSTRWELMGSTSESKFWDRLRFSYYTHETCRSDVGFVSQYTTETVVTNSASDSGAVTGTDSTTTWSESSSRELVTISQISEERTIIEHAEAWLGRVSSEMSEAFGYAKEWETGDHAARVWVPVDAGGFVGFGGESWAPGGAVYSRLETALEGGSSLADFPVGLGNLPAVPVAEVSPVNDAEVRVRAWPTANHGCIGSVLWSNKFATQFSTDEGVSTRASLLVTYTETVATTAASDPSTTAYPATVGMSAAGAVTESFLHEHGIFLGDVAGSPIAPVASVYQTGQMAAADWGTGAATATLTCGVWSVQWWDTGETSAGSTLETTITDSAETVDWPRGSAAGITHEKILAVMGSTGGSYMVTTSAAEYLTS